jgi:gamma-glutamyl hydrolase
MTRHAFIALLLASCPAVFAGVALNDRPIVAIFTHPSTHKGAPCNGDCDYLAASYVKWVESAGGRAVPVPFDATLAKVDEIFASTNALLFPGGGASINNAAKHFFNRAVDANSAGDHYPVWGTCLGFQWLLQVIS